MKKRMNKKGAEISLNFIIIAILGVIALIGIVFFFLGGAEFFAKKEKTTVLLTEQDKALAEAACNLYCSTENKAKWDNPGFSEEFKKSFNQAQSCEDLLTDKDWVPDCVPPEVEPAQ